MGFFTTLLLKEVLEMVRDRRTIFILLLTPLVLASVFVCLQIFISRTEVKSSNQILVVGNSALIDNAKVKVTPMESFDEAKLSVQSYSAAAAIMFTQQGIEVEQRAQDFEVTEAIKTLVFDSKQLLAKDVKITWQTLPQIHRIQPEAILSSVEAMVIAILIYVGISSVVNESVAGEKEDGMLELLMETAVSGKMIITTKIIALAVTGVTCGLIYLFTIQLLGQAQKNWTLSNCFVDVAAIVSAALFLSSTLTAICLYAKSRKEGQALIVGYGLLIITLPTLIFILPTDHISTLHLIPFLNSCMLLKEGESQMDMASVLFSVVSSSLLLCSILVWNGGNYLEKEYRH